jgi:hypothetical protein
MVSRETMSFAFSDKALYAKGHFTKLVTLSGDAPIRGLAEIVKDCGDIDLTRLIAATGRIIHANHNIAMRQPASTLCLWTLTIGGT